MKKLLIFAVAMIALASCQRSETDNSAEMYQQRLNRQHAPFFRKVEYDGHRYVIYEKYNGSKFSEFGLTHDPDCQCNDE